MDILICSDMQKYCISGCLSCMNDYSEKPSKTSYYIVLNAIAQAAFLTWFQDELNLLGGLK